MRASVRDVQGDAISMVRSVHRGDMKRVPFAGQERTLLRLWWGAVVEIGPGDELVYFETPVGAAVESVGRPA